MNNKIITNNSKWSLVVLRVSKDNAKVWVGTLFPNLEMPDQAYVELGEKDKPVQRISIVKSDWQRPFRNIRKRFFTTVVFENLKPGTHYRLRFIRLTEKIHWKFEKWQPLRDGQFDTLPSRVPTTKQRPFTVGLGSCFYEHRDGGQAAGSYRALYEHGPKTARPDVTFLTGDQVYLDIGFDSLSIVKSEIRDRIACDYAKHWQALGSILTRGATWMLSDDHEFWNDYPFYDSLIPTLLALKLPHVRKTWDEAAMDGVKRVQQCPRVEQFDLGKDLSFFLADVRSRRSKQGFMAPKDLKLLTDWAESLQCPGVLVISQPLIVNNNPTEKNLLSFKSQYRKLVQALGTSGHDIVLLSGDVHFGRISSVVLGPKGGRLIEVIASPMSNLTGLNGVATSTPELKTPRRFPDPAKIRIPGWTSKPVTYDQSFAVSTRPGFPLSAYPKARTTEHFMTASFQRNGKGEINLAVNAWRVRDRDGNNLPKRDFNTYRARLK